MKSLFTLAIVLLTSSALADDSSRSPDKAYDCLQNCSASVCPIELSLCSDVGSKPAVQQCVSACVATKIVQFPNSVVDKLKPDQLLVMPTNAGASCQTVCDSGTALCHPVCSGAANASSVNGNLATDTARKNNCFLQGTHLVCLPPAGAAKIPQSWVDDQTSVQSDDRNRVLPSRAEEKQIVESQFDQIKAETASAERKRRELAKELANDQITSQAVANEAISAYEAEVNAPEPTYDTSSAGDSSGF